MPDTGGAEPSRRNTRHNPSEDRQSVRLPACSRSDAMRSPQLYAHAAWPLRTAVRALARGTSLGLRKLSDEIHAVLRHQRHDFLVGLAVHLQKHSLDIRGRNDQE